MQRWFSRSRTWDGLSFRRLYEQERHVSTNNKQTTAKVEGTPMFASVVDFPPCTLDEFCGVLFDGNIDANKTRTMEHFLLCIPSFTTKEQVWDILVSSFKDPEGNPKICPLYFLTLWLDLCFERDFTQKGSLFSAMITFVSTLPHDHSNRFKLSIIKLSTESPTEGRPKTPRTTKRSSEDPELCDPKREKSRSFGHSLSYGLLVDSPKNSPTPPSKRHSRWLVGAGFIGMRGEEIARQITLYEHQLFLSVPILSWAVDPQKLDPQDPLRLWIGHFNVLSAWLTKEIVTTTDLGKRARTLAKCIHIGHHLFELRNFDGLMAVLGALGSIAVVRLTKTWEVLDSKTKEMHSRLEKTMDNRENYRVYRGLFKELSTPCVPFTGLIVRDLTFLKQIPIYLPNKGGEKPLLNTEFLRIAGGILLSTKKLQKDTYGFGKNTEFFEHLKGLPKPAEDDLYDLSLLCEPNKAD